MTEEEKEEETKITWIDGIACYDLPQKPVIRRKIPGQKRPVNHPFNFGWLQEQRTRKFMPDMMDDLKNFFNFPSFSNSEWKLFKIDENGKMTEVKKEEEEDDN